VAKNMIKKCAMLLIIALFSFVRVAFVQADSERMYEIKNHIKNGNYATDGDGNGVADFWSSGGSDIKYIENGVQYVRDASFSQLTQNISSGILISGHKYYISFDFYNVSGTNPTIYIWVTSSVHIYSNTALSTGHYSKIITMNATGSGYIECYRSGTNNGFGFGNFMMFDLSLIFGLGNEPSLSDFEQYYLPDSNYFTYYNSFDPTNYLKMYASDYANIGTDLTGIDYSKSIIARNGDNMTLDFYAYFYDSPDATGSSLALHYFNYNRPEIRYLGTDYSLLWEYSDYSDRVLKLSLTDEQNDIMKTVLFNRVVDPDNEYFEFRIDAYFWDYVKIYVVMSSTLDLLVDVKSFMISRETVTLNNFNINNEMNVKTYDQNGDIYLPIIKLNLAGDALETRVIDGFGSGYTRISRFNFEFEFTSPENDDPYAYELQYLYELGIFSSDDVLIPTRPTIPEYLDGIFPYQVCDAFQIGCHIKNGINDIVLWLWDSLNINEIIAVFDSVILAVGSLVSLIPGGLASLMLVFTGIIGIGIIITIYDRVTKGGGD
jgi:hypothetical protein